MADKFQGVYRIPSARLTGYDYGSNGDYFVTICTKNRQPYFGEVISIDGKDIVQVSEIGRIAETFWKKIPEHFSFVIMDEFVVMPNHLHGVLKIRKKEMQGPVHKINTFGPQSGNLSSILRLFKGAVKTQALKKEIEFDWQPRFYDRIIRNDFELMRIRQYIKSNPKNWATDRNNETGLLM